MESPMSGYTRVIGAISTPASPPRERTEAPDPQEYQPHVDAETRAAASLSSETACIIFPCRVSVKNRPKRTMHTTATLPSTRCWRWMNTPWMTSGSNEKIGGYTTKSPRVPYEVRTTPLIMNETAMVAMMSERSLASASGR